MSLNSKQLNDDFAKFFDKEPSKLEKWYQNLPDKGWLKETAQWFKFKYRRFISDPWYDLKYGIRNYRQWYKVIWKDRNWGYESIYTLLQYKITLMRDLFIKNNRHTDIDITSRDMKLASDLIEKVKEEFYSMEPYDYHKIEMVFTPCEDKPNFSTLDFKIIWEKYDNYLAKYPNSVRVINKKYGILPEKKELVRRVAEYNQEKAKKLLFRLLEERIESFWD